MSTDGPFLLVVAVEASADLHGAAVLRELKVLLPGLRAFGAAGPLLRAEGVEALVRAEDLSVMGIAEVLPALPRIFAALGRLGRVARERRPRAALLIDSPDFNLRLAKRLRRLGVRVVYFIGPSVWAWRTYRVRQIARDVTRMLVILPFEAAFYAQHGVQAIYVGNPLADELRPQLGPAPGPGPQPQLGSPGAPPRSAEQGGLAQQAGQGARAQKAAQPQAAKAQEAGQGGQAQQGGRAQAPDRALLRARLGLDPARPLLALLPGSRKQEIHRLWAPLLGAAKLLVARHPGLQLAVPVAKTIARSSLEPAAREAGLELHFLDSQAPALLAAADLAIVASGTATLEAALAQVPLVVVYRLSWLSWVIGRLLVRVKFVSLVNLLAGRRLVPELLQSDCTSEAIAREADALLAPGPGRDDQLRGLRQILDELAPAAAPHAARRAAAEVASVLEAP